MPHSHAKKNTIIAGYSDSVLPPPNTGSVSVNNSSSGSGGIPASQHKRFEKMQQRPENRVCFDCGSRQPRWASTNLGVFFCLRCAGIHRAMGVTISKVKSTNMDLWDEPMMNLIEHIGNARGRILYEHNMPSSMRPMPHTDPSSTERLLRAKYERKAYYHPQFATILKEFLDTPIADGTEGAAAARAPVAPPPAPAQAPMEELWGAPIAATPQAPPPQPVQQQTAATGSSLNVAELFADSNRAPYPSIGTGGGYFASQLQMGGAQLPHRPEYTNNERNQYNNGQMHNSPLGGPHGGWGPLDRQTSDAFSRHTSTMSNPSSTTNVDDIFATPSTPQPEQQQQQRQAYQQPPTASGGGSESTKNEILSLFNVPSRTSNVPYAAWQPQEVKPFNYPS